MKTFICSCSVCIIKSNTSMQLGKVTYSITSICIFKSEMMHYKTMAYVILFTLLWFVKSIVYTITSSNTIAILKYKDNV